MGMEEINKLEAQLRAATEAADFEKAKVLKQEIDEKCAALPPELADIREIDEIEFRMKAAGAACDFDKANELKAELERKVAALGQPPRSCSSFAPPARVEDNDEHPRYAKITDDMQVTAQVKLRSEPPGTILLTS